MSDRFIHVSASSLDELITQLNEYVKNTPLGRTVYIGPSMPFDPKNPVSAIFDYGYVPVITYEDITGINAELDDFDTSSTIHNLPLRTISSA